MMPFALLAESSPTFTPGELASFLGIAAFVLTLVVLSRKVFGHDPALHREYVTKHEHAELKLEVEKIDRERRTSVANLHAKIDEQTREINSRIDEVPRRTIELLNSTKQLHDHSK